MQSKRSIYLLVEHRKGFGTTEVFYPLEQFN